VTPSREDFEEPPLALHWNFLRTSPEEYLSLNEKPGYLRLHLRPQRLAELSNPSLVARRQQHICFRATTAMEFLPQSENECAGLALIQNNDFHFLFVVTDRGGPVLQLIRRAAGKEELISQQAVSAERFYLKIEAVEQAYQFYYSKAPHEWQKLAGDVDGRILSTPVAGGFLGAYIGMYASSNGKPSSNQADFDWFEYVELTEEPEQQEQSEIRTVI
jgi:alpha-N-arabinofuranosidase